MRTHDTAREFARLIFANWIATIPQSAAISKNRVKRATPKGFFWAAVYPGPYAPGPIILTLPLNLRKSLRRLGVQQHEFLPYDDDSTQEDALDRLYHLLKVEPD